MMRGCFVFFDGFFSYHCAPSEIMYLMQKLRSAFLNLRKSEMRVGGEALVDVEGALAVCVLWRLVVPVRQQR